MIHSLFGEGLKITDQTAHATVAPKNWAMTKKGASSGRIPENVSEKQRAIVTAGFAKDVEAVNQYAAVIYKPTIKAKAFSLALIVANIVRIRPNVAITSEKNCASPVLTFFENCITFFN